MFLSAMKLMARRKKADITDVAVTVDVGLNSTVSAAFSCPPPCTWRCPVSTRQTADKLVEAAHQVCPYSNATRGNIEVTVDTIVG